MLHLECLSLLTDEMGIKIVPMSWGCFRIKCVKIYEGLRMISCVNGGG